MPFRPSLRSPADSLSTWRRDYSPNRRPAFSRSMIRTTPSAARRKPNGSRLPDGFLPSAKMPASVSILSATANRAPASDAGMLVAGKLRQVLLGNRLGHRIGFAGGAGVVARPSRPAAPETLPTMPVSRSALAQGRGADQVCRIDSEVARPLFPPASATRFDLSLRQRTKPLSDTRRHRACRRVDPSGVCWSVSQKKAASASRGSITRSLPCRTRSGSLLSRFETVMNAGQKFEPLISDDREVTLMSGQGRDNDLPGHLQEGLRRNYPPTAPAIPPAPLPRHTASGPA